MPKTPITILEACLSPHRLLLDALEKAGARVYLVGGAVRDAHLGVTPKDLDMEVHGLEPEKLEEVLKGYGPVNFVGRHFGIYHTPQIEFSLPRFDTKTAPGHKGFETKIDLSLTFEQATKRRDLTVNALGYDIKSGKVVDFHQGLKDLASGCLRAVDPSTFKEDPLRGLRVAQFAARFEMTPDKTLIDLSAALDLSELPAERLRMEIEKMLRQGKAPSLGLTFLRQTNLLRFLPFDQPSLEKNWVHLCESLDRGANPPKRFMGEKLPLMLAVLGFMGKQERYRQALKTLTFLHKIVSQAEGLIKALKEIPHVVQDSASRSTLCHFQRALMKKDLSLEGALWLADIIDVRAHYSKAYQKRAKDLKITEQSIRDVVKGRDLINRGYEPGPTMQALLNTCLEIQYENGLVDADDIIDRLGEKMPRS